MRTNKLSGKNLIPVSGTAPGFSKSPFWRNTVVCLKRDWRLYVIMLPFILFYIIFVYKPMYGLQIAFKDYNLFKGIEGSPWVGLKHFINYFTGPYFSRTLFNTVAISLLQLLFGFPVPIILALLFNEVRNKHFKSIGQTISYLPYFISAVVVAGIVTNILSPESGVVNAAVKMLGGEPVYFLTKSEYFRPIYIIMTIWKESGFGAIIYVAALAAIDVQLYEAAVMDGAGKWRQTWHVTLPGILPTIAIMLILRIGKLLEVGYETIILLYQPSTYETADVISTYVYRSGIGGGDYSLAAAAGLFNSVVGLILVVLSNKVSNKLTETGLW